MSDFKPEKRVRDKSALKRFRLLHAGEPCELDGCGRAGIHLHHEKFRSQGGSDVEANLIWLCGFHHDQAHGIRRVEH